MKAILCYPLPENMENPTKESFFIASERPFWWTVFRNILSKSQRVHIFVNLGKFEIQLNHQNGRWNLCKMAQFQQASTERRELAWISYSRSL